MSQPFVTAFQARVCSRLQLLIAHTSLYRLVFTAGNADTFSRVLLTLKLLRNHYNTSLPAEIFSFPGEMPPPELLDEFVKYNATLKVVGYILTLPNSLIECTEPLSPFLDRTCK